MQQRSGFLLRRAWQVKDGVTGNRKKLKSPESYYQSRFRDFFSQNTVKNRSISTTMFCQTILNAIDSNNIRGWIDNKDPVPDITDILKHRNHISYFKFRIVSHFIGKECCINDICRILILFLSSCELQVIYCTV